MQSLLNRAVTTSPPDPQDGFWVVNFLLFMREAPAEMVGGHAGRNPSPVMAKMKFALATPGGHNRLRCPGIMAAGTGTSAREYDCEGPESPLR
jgi:hypothetical protein